MKLLEYFFFSLPLVVINLGHGVYHTLLNRLTVGIVVRLVAGVVLSDLLFIFLAAVDLRDLAEALLGPLKGWGQGPCLLLGSGCRLEDGGVVAWSSEAAPRGSFVNA